MARQPIPEVLHKNDRAAISYLQALENDIGAAGSTDNALMGMQMAIANLSYSPDKVSFIASQCQQSMLDTGKWVRMSGFINRDDYPEFFDFLAVPEGNDYVYLGSSPNSLIRVKP